MPRDTRLVVIRTLRSMSIVPCPFHERSSKTSRNDTHLGSKRFTQTCSYQILNGTDQNLVTTQRKLNSAVARFSYKTRKTISRCTETTAAPRNLINTSNQAEDCIYVSPYKIWNKPLVDIVSIQAHTWTLWITLSNSIIFKTAQWHVVYNNKEARHAMILIVRLLCTQQRSKTQENGYVVAQRCRFKQTTCIYWLPRVSFFRSRLITTHQITIARVILILWDEVDQQWLPVKVSLWAIVWLGATAS